MPIIKRKNIPVTAQRPDDLGTPIEELIEHHDRVASEADWKGDRAIADEHTAKGNEYREMRERGIYYIKE